MIPALSVRYERPAADGKGGKLLVSVPGGHELVERMLDLHERLAAARIGRGRISPVVQGLDGASLARGSYAGASPRPSHSSLRSFSHVMRSLLAAILAGISSGLRSSRGL